MVYGTDWLCNSGGGTYRMAAGKGTAQLVVVPQVQISNSAERRGSNWVHGALVEQEVPGCGYGAFAREPVRAGTTLIVYGGRVLTLEQFEALSIEMQNYPYQVEEELFLGPVNESDIGVGERLNHSCQPNAGFNGAIHIVALRDIAAGEQVTIDYASCVSADHDAFAMECSCGLSCCRGTVTAQDWKIPAVQASLLPFFQPYLQRKVQGIEAGRVAQNLDRSSLQLVTTSANSDLVAPGHRGVGAL